MENCIFCSIVNGKIPSEIVYSDEHVVCFKDINPEAPVHLLIVPKKHIGSINELTTEDKELVGHIYIAAQELAKKFGAQESGYRVVTNCGKDAGQTVQHIHFHLLAGRNLTWPPG
jgi:histidine triad (HIT) family protein